MARKPTAKQEILTYNVHYEDGSVTSNRKVPAAEASGLDVEVEARNFFEAQDREIAERSGRPRPRIKSIERVKSR